MNGLRNMAFLESPTKQIRSFFYRHNFLQFIFKKAFYTLFLFYSLITLVFLFFQILPGDPFVDEEYLSPDIINAKRQAAGLNDPLLVQYKRYVVGILTGNWGESLKYSGKKVSSFIFRGFRLSFILGLQGFLFAATLGVFLGTIAGLKQHRWQDHTAIFISLLGISLHSTVLASLLRLFFSLKLKWFPLAFCTRFEAHTFWSWLRYTALPTLTIAAGPTAYIARLMRTSVLETLTQDYIVAAKGKGLSTFRIITHHVLRNSLFPVISSFRLLLATLLTGSFVAETSFAIPGIARDIVCCVTNRDYPVIMGMCIFCLIIFLLVSFFIDVLYGLLDPRVRGESE